jgi:hypothetical protein
MTQSNRTRVEKPWTLPIQEALQALDVDSEIDVVQPTSRVWLVVMAASLMPLLVGQIYEVIRG